MKTYTLRFENVDDSSQERSFDIVAESDRQAMMQANEQLQSESGDSAWNLVEVMEGAPWGSPTN